MNIITWIVWGVKLNNPIDQGDIQPSSCYVRAQKCALFRITELEERRCPFLLFLLALWDQKLEPGFMAKCKEVRRTCKSNTGTSI